MVFKPQTFHEQEPTVELENPPHAALETLVAEALGVAGGIDATDVSVTVTGTTVTLRGIVLSPGEVIRAEEVARSVHGVDQVHNHIRAQQDF